MNHSGHSPNSSRVSRGRFWLVFFAFVVAAGFLLWEEHQAHILGALPYLFLLLCPLLHVFMHGDHGGHGNSGGDGR